MPVVYTVIYDACVLYPAPLRDLLIQLATAGLFRARWTNSIHDEWTRSLLAARPDLAEEQLARTRRLMDEAVPDCLVTGYEPLIAAIDLPDQNDRHVLAAAIHGRADAIVTFNLKDFPAGVLEPYGVEALHPDEFMEFQADLDEAAAIIAAQNCRARLRNPIRSAEEYLETLLALGLPKTVSLLSRFSSVL